MIPIKMVAGPVPVKPQDKDGFKSIRFATFNVDYLTIEKSFNLCKLASITDTDVTLIQEANVDNSTIEYYNTNLRSFQLFAHSQKRSRNENPHNQGVAIMVRNNLAKQVRKIFTSTEMGRAMALVLHVHHTPICIINVYGHVHETDVDRDNLALLLNDISGWLEYCQAHRIPAFLGGDLNAGLHNSHRSSQLYHRDKSWSEFLTANDLAFTPEVNLQQCFNFSRKGKSLINHFAWQHSPPVPIHSANLFISTNRFGINTSGHLPTFLTLQITSSSKLFAPPLPRCTPEFYTDWEKTIPPSHSLSEFIESFKTICNKQPKQAYNEPLFSPEITELLTQCTSICKTIQDIYTWNKIGIPFNMTRLPHVLQSASSWTESLNLAKNERRKLRRDIHQLLYVESERDLNSLHTLNSSQLFRYARKKQHTQLISSTVQDGTSTSEPKIVLQRTWEFFKHANTAPVNANSDVDSTVLKYVSDAKYPNLTSVSILHEIGMYEFADALKHFGHTSPGCNNMAPKIIKAAPLSIQNKLRLCLNNCLANKDLPAAVKQGITTAIFKSNVQTNDSSINDFNNYRPITVMCWTYRLLLYIIATRLNKLLYDSKFLSPFQFGFVPHQSTTKAIHLINNFFESANEVTRCKRVNWVGIDFANAYGSINHKKLCNLMTLMTLPTDLCTFVKNIYVGQSTCIKTACGITNQFPIEKGVLQGCPLSPLLWNIYIDPVLQFINTKYDQILWPNVKAPSAFAYADDIHVCQTNTTTCQQICTDIETYGTCLDLKVKESKCESLCLQIVHKRDGSGVTYKNVDHLFMLNGLPIKKYDAKTPVRFLGAHRSMKHGFLASGAFVLFKLKRASQCINTKKLHIKAIIQILDTLVLSQTRYTAYCGALNSKVVTKAEAIYSMTIKRKLYINQQCSPSTLFGPAYDNRLEITSVRCTQITLLLVQGFRNLNDFDGSSMLAITSRFLFAKAIVKLSDIDSTISMQDILNVSSFWLKFVLLLRHLRIDTASTNVSHCLSIVNGRLPTATPMAAYQLPPQVEVWTDASVLTRRNQILAAGAYFVVEPSSNTAILDNSFMLPYVRDSARAELLTILHFFEKCNDNIHVSIYTDSMYAKIMINDRESKLTTNHKEQNLDALAKISIIIKKKNLQVSIHWIPSHTDQIEKSKKWNAQFPWNIKADKLANTSAANQINSTYHAINISNRIIPLIDCLGGINIKGHIKQHFMTEYMAHTPTFPSVAHDHKHDCRIPSIWKNPLLSNKQKMSLFKIQHNGFYSNWNNPLTCPLCETPGTHVHFVRSCPSLLNERDKVQHQLRQAVKKYPRFKNVSITITHPSQFNERVYNNTIQLCTTGLYAPNSFSFLLHFDSVLPTYEDATNLIFEIQVIIASFVEVATANI